MLRNGVGPVGVEQGRRARAVGQAEVVARRPIAPGEVAIEPGIGRVELRAPLVAAIVMLTADRDIDQALLRIHDVIVEEAIPHPSLDRHVGVSRNQGFGG